MTEDQTQDTMKQTEGDANTSPMTEVFDGNVTETGVETGTAISEGSVRDHLTNQHEGDHLLQSDIDDHTASRSHHHQRDHDKRFHLKKSRCVVLGELEI